MERARALLACLTLAAPACDVPASDTIEAPTVEYASSSDEGRPIDVGTLGTHTLTFSLPRELREISGMAPVDETKIACIEDETGTAYLIDVSGAPIVRTQFGPKGDYEAMALAHGRFYVVRGDGILLELTGVSFEFGFGLAGQFPLLSPYEEFESLTYDSVSNLLLTVPKGGSKDKAGTKSERPIYGFSLESRSWLVKPVLVLDRKVVVQQAKSKGLDLPVRRTNKGKLKTDFKMQISALAVSPLDGHYFAMCGPDYTILRFDRAGKLIDTHVFQPEDLPQAEGLSFTPSGTLMVSSESDSGPAVLIAISPE